jgi:DNA end-binding protein Ku
MPHARNCGMDKRKSKSKSKSKSASKHRASWRGHLSFGLVSFPVQAINALNRQGSDIHFHQLHAQCHRRIHHQKVCPVHGEVSNDEIVSGFEKRKGKYIEIEPEELDAIRTKKERSLTIDAFVDPSTIDPLYFDGRMYYLVPDGPVAEEPYSTIAEAMEQAECWGIGQIVFSGKDQIVAVRPVDGRLHMAMLNYDEEIRTPAEILPRKKRSRGNTKQVQLAKTLINAWYSDDFDFTAYDDHYRERLQRLIKAKAQGKEVVAPAEEEEPEVINLMDALKQSVAEARSGRSSKRGRKRRRSA